MSTVINAIYNANGSKELKRDGTMRRLHATTVCLRGVELNVEYAVEGGYCAATATDDAEWPLCVVKRIEAGGVDITRLLADTRAEEELAERIEASWRGE